MVLGGGKVMEYSHLNNSKRIQENMSYMEGLRYHSDFLIRMKEVWEEKEKHLEEHGFYNSVSENGLPITIFSINKKLKNKTI